MSLKQSKRVLRVPQTICDEFEERAVDMDVVLPDYCPDVAVILKCIMHPMISGRFQSGDRYTVDGTTTLRILYLAEDRAAVHCYEVSQPFNVSFQVNGARHHVVEAKSDYVNCRATGPRRVDIHGAFRVFLKAYGEGEMTVFADPNKREVCCKTRLVSCTIPITQTEKSFAVSEAISLGVRAEKLIYTDFTVASCDFKSLMNKMIVKGTLNVKAVYSDGETVSDTVHELPFSQIVDIDGLCDHWQSRVTVEVGGTESYLQKSENGGTMLFVNAKLTACVYCHTTETADVVLDAYSVDCPLHCDMVSLDLPENSPRQIRKLPLQQMTQLPESVTDVMDIWGEVKSCELKDQDVRCCVLVGMIGQDETGHLGYYERTVDYAAACDPSATACAARLIAINGAVSGGQLRVQSEIEFSIGSDACESLNVVGGVTENEQQPYHKNGASIRVVYADPGEVLWDIAKQHHSSVRDILIENDLTSEDITVPTMLMIPVI